MFWSDKLEGSRWYMQHACPGVTQHVLVIKCLLCHILSLHNIVSSPWRLIVSQFSAPPKRLQMQSSKMKGYLLEMDLFRIWVTFWRFTAAAGGDLTFCWKWKLMMDQQRTKKIKPGRPFKSSNNASRQEGTMCCENNVKYLGLRNFMTWTRVKWLHLYHTRMIVVVCLAPSPNPIPALWTQGKCSST